MEMDRARFEEIINSMHKHRIAVLGDLMLDEYIWGRVTRISPEAPVPVVQVERESDSLGGAGNVLMNVIALEATPVGFGVVGADAAGRRVLDALVKGHLESSTHVFVDESRPTTVKTRVVAHSQHVVRVDREHPAPLTGDFQRKMLDRLQSEIGRLDAVTVSDYGKGVISREFLGEIVRICVKANVPLLLDPKFIDLDGIGPVTVITPNEREAERLSRIPITDQTSLEAAGAELLKTTGARHILITRGERGMALFTAGGAPAYLSTWARQVFDVTGAGDTVIAILATATAAGASMFEAAQLANMGAGIVVGRVGTATVSRKDLLSALDGRWPTSVGRGV